MGENRLWSCPPVSGCLRTAPAVDYTLQDRLIQANKLAASSKQRVFRFTRRPSIFGAHSDAEVPWMRLSAKGTAVRGPSCRLKTSPQNLVEIGRQRARAESNRSPRLRGSGSLRGIGSFVRRSDTPRQVGRFVMRTSDRLSQLVISGMGPSERRSRSFARRSSERLRSVHHSPISMMRAPHTSVSVFRRQSEKTTQAVASETLCFRSHGGRR